MMKKHEHWFTLEIKHPYFYNEECPVFDLLPTPETLRIMKNYDIRFQKLNNQYHFYAAIDPSKKIWEELNTAEDLFFQLINSDPSFDTYTNIVLPKKEDAITYITNTKIVNRFSDEMAIVPETNLSVRPLVFNQPVSKDDATNIILKKDNQEIFTGQSQEKQTIIPVDIRAFGNGVYELWINGSLTTNFFGSASSLTTNCYGILHINMRNVLESLKENTLPVLTANFDVRDTYKEYLVIVPNNKKINIKSMHIESPENEEYAAPEKKMVFDNQEEATVFTSINPIALQQKVINHPVLKIQYTHQFSDVLLELDIKMPTPKVTSVITKTKNNENAYYSQTIIYV